MVGAGPGDHQCRAESSPPSQEAGGTLVLTRSNQISTPQLSMEELNSFPTAPLRDTHIQESLASLE